MRESIGSTYIFSICVTFIILFTAYLAISVNYNKAFKIKNHIVDTIEEQKGYDMHSLGTYLTAQSYSAYNTCPNAEGWSAPACVNQKQNGECAVCIYEMNVNDTIDEICGSKKYYKVVTFFTFDLPIVNVFLKFNISGETKPIYTMDGNNNIQNSICG